MEKKILFGMLPFILWGQLGQNILYNESLYRMYGMLNVKGGVQKVLFSQDKLQRIIPEGFFKIFIIWGGSSIFVPTITIFQDYFLYTEFKMLLNTEVFIS